MADHGQPDAGVARGAFHDCLAGLQPAGGFRIGDDAQCGAVLDRAAGFMNSALPRISQPVNSDSRRNRINGVLPT